MNRRTSLFKQRDIARAVRGAKAAGINIGRVDVDPITEKISIVPTGQAVNNSELDRELEEFDARHGQG
jgi:hypothetical protein